jgi:hypothetical protein
LTLSAASQYRNEATLQSVAFGPTDLFVRAMDVSLGGRLVFSEKPEVRFVAMQGPDQHLSRRLLGRLGLGIALLCCAALVGPASASALQAVAPDGSVFVAWGDVEVTRIDPDGVPSGVVYDIAPEAQLPSSYEQTENSHLTNMAVAPDGTVTLVWLDIVHWDARIMTRQLAPDGTPLGEPVAIATGQEIHIVPRLGIGPDGTATVTWGRLVGPGSEVAVRRIAPDGTPEEGTQVLSAPGASVYRPAMAMAPDGTATVVWTENGEGDSDLLMERRIAPDGTPDPVTHQLGESPWAMDEPQVEDAADGTAAVLWDQWELEGDNQLWTRRIKPDGSPEASGHLLDEAPTIAFANLAVAPDGTSLVTWSIGHEQWREAFVEPDGTPAATQPITLAGSQFERWPGVATTPDNRFILTWADICGSEECNRTGEIEESGEIADPVTFEEGGALGGGNAIYLPDGTGNLVWSQTFSIWDPAAIRTRRVAPDGTLGQIYDLVAGEAGPLVKTDLKELDFGEVEIGSSLVRSVPLFVGSIEPLGTFSVSIAGPDADRFQVDGSTCGPDDATPTNCHVSVSFAPSSSGPASAELVIDAGTHGVPVTLPLAGTGTSPAPELPAPPPPSAAPPSSPQVQLGKPALDSSTGTASLPVTVPAAGTVTISGPCVGGPVAARSAQIAAAGTVEIQVLAKSHCRGQLLRTGTTRFGVVVTFTASDGQATVDYRPVRLRLAMG